MLIVDLRELSYEIELFLNPREELSKKIIEKINLFKLLCTDFYNADAEVVNNIRVHLEELKKEKINEIMKSLLKTEWERVKKGE